MILECALPVRHVGTRPWSTFQCGDWRGLGKNTGQALPRVLSWSLSVFVLKCVPQLCSETAVIVAWGTAELLAVTGGGDFWLHPGACQSLASQGTLRGTRPLTLPVLRPLVFHGPAACPPWSRFQFLHICLMSLYSQSIQFSINAFAFCFGVLGVLLSFLELFTDPLRFWTFLLPPSGHSTKNSLLLFFVCCKRFYS